MSETHQNIKKKKRILHVRNSPWPLGGEEVVLHLVLKWNERSNGIEQGQALWFVDDQLQVPDQHGEVHGPGRAERTHLHSITDAVQRIALLFFLNEHAIGIRWVVVGFACQRSLYQISFFLSPTDADSMKPCDRSIEDKRHPEQQLSQRCFGYSMKSVHRASTLNYSSEPIQLCLEGDPEKGAFVDNWPGLSETVETDQRLNQHGKRFIETWSPQPPPND